MKHLATITIIVLLGVAIFQARRQSELAHEIEALKTGPQGREAAAERQEPREIRVLTVAPPAPQPAEPLPAAAADPSAAASDPAAHEQAARDVSAQAIAEATDRVFYKQSVDMAWARDAKYALRDEIGKVAPAGMLNAVECRQTMCKAELGGDGSYGLGEFANKLLRGERPRTWQGAVTVVKTGEAPDGRWTGVAYFAREGESLPVVD